MWFHQPINALHYEPQHNSIREVAEGVAWTLWFKPADEVDDCLVSGLCSFRHGL
jgi:hypothetical protein